MFFLCCHFRFRYSTLADPYLLRPSCVQASNRWPQKQYCGQYHCQIDREKKIACQSDQIGLDSDYSIHFLLAAILDQPIKFDFPFKHSSKVSKIHLIDVILTLYGTFRIFMSLRFYVKSILENVEVPKLPFLQLQGL